MAAASQRPIRLLVINPNSTEAMTGTILAIARAMAPSGAVIEGATNAAAPAAIEGPEDGEAAIPGVLALVRDNPHHDGYLIACFDDTGLQEAREVTTRPVIGIGEASYLKAAHQGRFSVVTTVPEAESVIEDNIAQLGLSESCRSVKAAEIAVLDLEFRKTEAVKRISAEIARQCDGNDISAIVLGCAGMANVLEKLHAPNGVHLVEPVSAGIAHLHHSVVQKG